MVLPTLGLAHPLQWGQPVRWRGHLGWPILCRGASLCDGQDTRAGLSSVAGPPCALEGQWMRPLRRGASDTRAGPSSAVGPACSMEGTLGLAHPLSQGQRVHCGVSSTLGLYRLGVGSALHPRSRNNQHVSKCCRMSLADKISPGRKPLDISNNIV